MLDDGGWRILVFGGKSINALRFDAKPVSLTTEWSMDIKDWIKDTCWIYGNVRAYLRDFDMTTGRRGGGNRRDLRPQFRPVLRN